MFVSDEDRRHGVPPNRALVCAVCVLTPLLAQAADVPSGGPALEEVVVNARRTAESTIDVPVAVTALGAEQLQRYNATDLKKIASLAPQVTISEGTSGQGASFNIRGVGSPPIDAGVEQSIVVNVDGVPVGRGRLVRQGFFDMESVEVLKGPQALFFGKNSPAGVISVSSADPGASFGGYSRLGYELEAREKYLEAAVDLPLSDTFAVRLAGRLNEMDGWIENRAQPNPNPWAPQFPYPGAAGNTRQPANEEQIFRATLLWTPSDALTAKLKLQGGRFQSNTDTAAAQSICGPGISVPTGNGAPDPYGDCDVNSYRSSSALPAGLLVDWPHSKSGRPYTDQDSVLSSLTLSYESDSFFDITSVTGFFDIDQRGFDDFTYTSVGRVFSTNLERTKQFSQELRLVTRLEGPLNYTFGAYYENSDRTGGAEPLVAYLGPDPATGRYFTFDRNYTTEGEAMSAFAQVRWNVTDRLELAAGARYTSEEKNTNMGNTWVHPTLAANFLATGQRIEAQFDDDDVSPEVTLGWKVSEESLLYAAYRTGYKSGGFSNSTVTASATGDNQRFESEGAEGGEIGYKGYLADNRIRLEAVAYHYTYSDLQQVSYDPTTVSQLVSNAAEATAKGGELSAEWRVNQALRLRAAIGYSDTTYDSYPTAPCYVAQTVALGCVGSQQDLGGRRLPRAPEWSNLFGLDYEGQFTDTLRWAFSADAAYTSDYAASDNLNPIGDQDAFWLYGSSLRLIGSGQHEWELALIGQNLSNEYYKSIAWDKSGGGPGQIAATVARPRQVAFQATYRF